jgi:hypothetical protein
MKPRTIGSIERDFPNQWLLIEVTATKNGTPSKGILLKAGPERQEIVEEIGRNKGKKLFSLFSGIPISHDTAFALAMERLTFMVRQTNHERFCLVRSP